MGEMKRFITQFDRTYIINLRDRPDRRSEAKKEFRRIGLVIPNDQVHFYDASRPSDRGNFHTVGARGVFTSHRNVLELAVKDKLQNVLVLEDDAVFRAVRPDHISQIVNRLRDGNWDIIYFGYISPSDRDLEGPLTPWNGITYGTHFYAVNGRFMLRMLEYMRDSENGPPGDPEHGPTSADGIHNRIRLIDSSVQVLLASPSLAFQRSSRTDVGAGSTLDRIPWLRSGMHVARGAKQQLRSGLDYLALHWRPRSDN